MKTFFFSADPGALMALSECESESTWELADTQSPDLWRFQPRGSGGWGTSPFF